MSGNGNGLFGSDVNPRERAAHIACAVVLSVTVLGVIVALIVYFTTGPVVVDCSGNEAHEAANHKTGLAKQAPKVKPVPAPVPKPVSAPAPPQRMAAASQGAPTFRESSGLKEALAAGTKNAQGVTTAQSSQAHSDQLQKFHAGYRANMAGQNPHMWQQSDAPILHGSYDQSIRGDLSDRYTDAALFAKHAPKWRGQGAIRHGQSEAYMQFLKNSDGQHHIVHARS